MTTTETSIDIDLLSSTLMYVVKPTIKEYYASKAKKLMDEWQGNCCAQTAVVVANIMNSSISKLGYTIKAYHGDFIDIIKGNQVEYNHCWVYCEHRTDADMSIFIDIGRTSKPCLVMFRKTNTYDKSIPEYRYQYVPKFVEIDYKASLQEVEYFTSEKGIIAYKAILERISNQKLFDDEK